MLILSNEETRNRVLAAADERGHRLIVVTSGPTGAEVTEPLRVLLSASSTLHLRSRAMARALVDRKVTTVDISAVSNDPAGLLSAIMCPNDTILLDMAEQVHERDVRVPEDISLTGYDGAGAAANPLLRLCTVRQPFMGGLLAAGRAGVSEPDHVLGDLADDYRRRHLDGDAHRRAYTGLLRPAASGYPGLAEALYQRLITPEGWRPYRRTLDTLARLRAGGVRLAVVSNTGYDLRPLGRAHGLVVDEWVLSMEVGAMKPDARLFRHACEVLGVPPGRCVMVGDTPADAGAAAIGIRTLVLPARGPGTDNGIGAVVDLVRRWDDAVDHSTE